MSGPMQSHGLSLGGECGFGPAAWVKGSMLRLCCLYCRRRRRLCCRRQRGKNAAPQPQLQLQLQPGRHSRRL